MVSLYQAIQLPSSSLLFSSISHPREQSGSLKYKACSTEDDSCHAGNESVTHGALVPSGKASKEGVTEAGNTTSTTTRSDGPSGSKVVEVTGKQGSGIKSGKGKESGGVDEEEGEGEQPGGGDAATGLKNSPLALISAPFRVLAGKIKGGFKRVVGARSTDLNQDQVARYRFASWVDNISGVVLFIGYMVAMIVILTLYS